MESIVLHSDIARLVLGYLINNNLKRAAVALCRTSPHLQQEFVALRQGLQPHNFLNGGLEDMIREHVKITGLVANAVHKLPSDMRQRLQQLRLSDRVSELLKHRNEKPMPAGARDAACQRNENNKPAQRKRRRMRSVLTDEEFSNSASPSPTQHASSKRPRLLAPHLYCSNERTLCRNQSLDNASLNSSTASDVSSGHTDEDAMHFHGHGPGPKNNSTPRTVNSDETDLMMPTPQTMPELTQAIMTNEDFQAKLLHNINMALQSVQVNAPTPESINAEAVLDGLVKNILEATEKDPSFDRIIQEVVGQEIPPGAADQTVPTVAAANAVAEPAPPQTPLIIRTAVASASESNNAANGNGNAIIQLNANNSIGTLIDPNFSISKLIVLNSNESAQKQQQQHHLLQPSTVNLSFNTENLINFVEGQDADAVANAAAVAAAAGGSQVCVDATNGQLTFPMILSNEGMLSHLPFLVNNEWLAQQLRSDVFANADVSHIEIPLPEPITVAANQLPPNSIIINSAVKQPPPPASAEPPAQLIAEPAAKPTPQATTGATAALLERSLGKVAMSNAAVPASLDSSRLVMERVTPSTSGIVNVKAFRSLSTPRKRTSHVRTLNFSPKAVPQAPSTPISSRRLQQQRQLRQQQQHKTHQQQQQPEQKEEKSVELQPSEKPVIIKSVEILPNFGNSSASTAAAATGATASAATSACGADLSANESNGCVPPLFAMEEGSNQTVIKAVTASKQSKQAKTVADVSADAMAHTPKRKQKRRVAAKACKRIISQTAAASDEPKPQQEAKETEQQKKEQKESKNASNTTLDDSKENQSVDALVPDVLIEKDEDLMAAWQRQMHNSSTDLEQRLREINAKRQELLQSMPRPRRPRVANKKKAGTPLGPTQKKLTTPPSAKRKKRKLLQQQAKKSANPEGEFKIKITTPHKPKKAALSVSQEEIKEVVSKEVSVEEPKQISEPKEAEKPQVEQQQEQEQEEAESKQASEIKSEETKEQEPASDARDNAGASLSMLFETPFKMTLTEPGDIPPTPGPALMPPLDTPYAKLLPSASFLFGSDTKSILDTPMLTAITPGMRLNTPFGHGLGTPHGSAAKTDYSSGSSYYRPDEAEHTDTNAQCALQPTPTTTRHQATTNEEQAQEQPAESAKKSPPAAASIELHAQRLPVEPMVLRRVRSFGTEAVESAEGAIAASSSAAEETAHYKLVSGLPDAIVDNSSSSSCASSSTFSSSSSSSSSGSSSSDSSAVSAASAAASASSQIAVKVATPAKTMQLLDMENLSEISSTEDEEWLKAAAASGDCPTDAPPLLAIDSEPTQLVSQDGEVRYPLRNWLTPSKDAAAAASTSANTSGGDMAPPAAPVPPAAAPVTPAAAPIPPAPAPAPVVVSPAKSPTALKIAQQAVIEQRRLDLAEVRERVKAKVKQQQQQPVPKPRAKKPNKKLTTMRETAQLCNPNPNASHKSPKKEAKPEAEKKKPAADPVKETKTPTASEPTQPSSDLDPALLIALNLSAKKQQLQHHHHHQPAKVARAAVEIAAQPAPGTKAAGQRRGRPKKVVTAVQPTRGSMRRSTRLIDNKTPAPEEVPASGAEDIKPAKVTKKPAKKRAEARLEELEEPQEESKKTEVQKEPKKPEINKDNSEPERQQEPELQPEPEAQLEPVVRLERLDEAEVEEAVSTLAEAHTTTQRSPEKPQQQEQQQQQESPPTAAPLSPAVSNGGYELNLCPSRSQVGNTFSFRYADNGSKPTKPVPRQPPAYFKNYQMRIMMDNEVHSVRITSPLLLHQTPSSSSNIRNIPKKRLIQFTTSSSGDEQLAKPQAQSTPLAATGQGSVQNVSQERDDTDHEVASINATPPSMKSSNTGEDPPLSELAERSSGAVQIDIESILSHLHGT